MDFAALSKMAKDATTKAKATATKLAEQAKERLEDTEGNKQMMQQFAEKVGRTLDEFIDEAPEELATVAELAELRLGRRLGRRRRRQRRLERRLG